MVDRRARLVARLDRMVASGQVTPAEADRLRGAGDPEAFEAAERDIRVRHAGAALGRAVAEGAMSREEADGLLRRLRAGEHPRGLRGHLARRRPAAGSGGDGVEP